MNRGKKLLLLSILVGAFPTVVLGMRETEEEIHARCEQSGLLYNYVDRSRWVGKFSREAMATYTESKKFPEIALSIIAGCKTDILIFSLVESRIRVKDIIYLGGILDEMLRNEHANQTDANRVQAFLTRLIDTNQISLSNLKNGLIPNPADTRYSLSKLISQMMSNSQPIKSKNKNVFSNMSLYKIIIPAVAVVALAVIVYKRLSKKQNTKNTVDADDERANDQATQEPAHLEVPGPQS